MAEKIRYAVVGLGYITQSAVLPAFARAKRNSLLTALVGGDHEPSGREGLIDTLIVRALLDSAERRRPIRLSLEGDEPPEPDQARWRYRPARRPGLVKVKAPAERR